jgi:hypothetical protein
MFTNDYNCVAQQASKMGETFTVQIVDVLGRTASTSTLRCTATPCAVETSGLADGLYVLTVQAPNQQPHTKRITIQH